MENLIDKDISPTEAKTASSNWFADHKASVTNIMALALIVTGYLAPNYNNLLISTGCFAFSGAITNWLAVHMLFEKVPLLYGSGIIPLRFEEFKLGIKNLMLEQFFTEANIQRFLTDSSSTQFIQNKIEHLDFEKIYQNLVEAIMQSSFGAMLGMMGGEEALKPLKEPIIEKLKLTLSDIAKENLADVESIHMPNSLQQQIENIVIERLNELTPQMVKNIIQEMIRKHLGWLVVWGGVFGGFIGFVIALSQN